MPYITQAEREAIDPSLAEIVGCAGALSAGMLNYSITRIINAAFRWHPSYTTANMLVGVLDSVKLEFYRRHVVPYEEQKMKENGDVI